ncbi:uncharacterized protein N7473_003950 [Penicillium subrubescens]|uniref:Uncharacterized protein n=1 Tax=Penicillium subrubescens TaxID=1316194 RepID=A0A1Q5UBH2_9EURO|nr:uncharacterized protein N7473_003950 [Penicillium subrubescens]KAJ5907034.1 hypothetical protein N7473_003950 [Penicillium subrubescens]OKP09811.1 hypothetical protein PENSUB_4735 [Penicillium subrubescens]
MFSSISTRDRLRTSMSTRSMRRARPVREPETVNPEVAKAQAKAAASRAMRSSASSTESKAYDRLGGLAQIAIPRRRPGSSLQHTEDDTSVYAASIAPPFTPRQSTEKPCTNRGHALEDSAVLPPITELQGLDGRDSSVPSSYRRLRKAKSMFSTRARSSHVPFGPPSMSPRNACELERSPEIELPRTLRPSISFIGGRRHGNRAIRHAKSHDAAIQLARDQFMDEAESPVAQVRRSSFFVRRKRDHKPFRKTFRVTSDTGPDSTSEHVSRWASRSRSRTFSSSIKSGLRRVFGFSKPAEREQSEFSLGDENISIATPETMVVNRPVECTLGGNMDMDQCFGSSPLPEESPGGDSLCTSKSRVTSWADSSVANTLMTRKTQHRQSLSLIEEHGDLNKQLPQVPTDRTRSQLPVCEGNIHELDKELNVGGFNTWADCNGLYSALMQQIRRQAVHTPDEDIVFGTVPEHRAIPERTSSVYSHRSRRTIRHIPSVESSTAGSFATARVGKSTSPKRRQPGPVEYISGKTSQRMSGQENHPPTDTSFAEYSPHSPFVICEDPDEDSGSVVIARSEALRTATESPSVYSRTTSGNTPTKGSSSCVASFIDGETGTATIFSSERTTYSSPTRTNGSMTSTPVRPSADWQKWMSSQIERIEQRSPTREHIREDAQFADDDDEIFMGMLKRTPVPRSEMAVGPYVPENERCNDSLPQAEPRSLVQNNFSRPFSRASSVRTILPSQKVQPLEPMENMPSPSEADSMSNPAVLDASPKPARVLSGWMRSPIRVRSSNMQAPPDSPTPRRDGPESQKRMWTQEQYRRYSARRPIANGKPNSFRSTRSYRDSRGMNNENTRQQEEHEDMINDYHKLQDIHSTISSKRMVEMFLDSRRQQMGREASGSTAAGGAFI